MLLFDLSCRFCHMHRQCVPGSILPLPNVKSPEDKARESLIHVLKIPEKLGFRIFLSNPSYTQVHPKLGKQSSLMC